MKKIKVYLDTSVLNFLYADDAPDFKSATEEFFHVFARERLYEIFVSDVVIKEILKTPDPQKKESLLNVIREYELIILELNEESNTLANVYLQDKILPANKIEDAQHVAIATVHQIDFLLSWNFKHLANVNKAFRIRAVNTREGYFYPIELITPLELMYEDS